MPCIKLVAHIGEQRNVTGAFDRNRQLALMICAGTGNAAGNNLRALGNVLAQTRNILVVDVVHTINAEAANFFAATALRTACLLYTSRCV